MECNLCHSAVADIAAVINSNIYRFCPFVNLQVIYVCIGIWIDQERKPNDNIVDDANVLSRFPFSIHTQFI